MFFMQRTCADDDIHIILEKNVLGTMFCYFVQPRSFLSCNNITESMKESPGHLFYC